MRNMALITCCKQVIGVAGDYDVAGKDKLAIKDLIILDSGRKQCDFRLGYLMNEKPVELETIYFSSEVPNDLCAGQWLFSSHGFHTSGPGRDIFVDVVLVRYKGPHAADQGLDRAVAEMRFWVKGIAEHVDEHEALLLSYIWEALERKLGLENVGRAIDVPAEARRQLEQMKEERRRREKEKQEKFEAEHVHPLRAGGSEVNAAGGPIAAFRIESFFSADKQAPPRLVGALYDLLRDHVQPGELERVVQENERMTLPVKYSNSHLAAYAQELAHRLTEGAPWTDSLQKK